MNQNLKKCRLIFTRLFVGFVVLFFLTTTTHGQQEKPRRRVSDFVSRPATSKPAVKHQPVKKTVTSKPVITEATKNRLSTNTNGVISSGEGTGLRTVPMFENQWPMDQLVLRSGKTLRGLVEERSSSELELVAIHQPAGRPMFLMNRLISRKEVVKWQPITSSQRADLVKRVATFRNRTRIEAGEIADITLQTKVSETGVKTYAYRGPWFTLYATTSPETTRWAAVRLNQLFRAYEQILGSGILAAEASRKKVLLGSKKQTNFSPLTIMLYGTALEYRQHLAAAKLSLKHPAYFSIAANRVVVVTSLGQVLERNKHLKKKHQQLLEALAGQGEQFVKKLAASVEAIKSSGATAAEIKTHVRHYRTEWRHQQTTLRSQIRKAEQKNNVLIQGLFEQLSRHLAHETLHAFVENWLYPEHAYQTPRWFHEGLAQIFETAQIDAGVMRVDRPEPKLLEKFQHDLKNKASKLSLRELLTAKEESFMIRHRKPAQVSHRHYLYSWALVYYLAIDQPLLGTDRLETFLKADRSHPKETVRRFEELVGMSLEQFEKQWHQKMLEPTSN